MGLVGNGDLWKSRAQVLQRQLRNRFRVVVDDHRCRPAIFSPEGYFSSTIERYLRRFRDFRRDSLPSSSTFYRKRVSREFTAEEESVLFRMLQAVAIPFLGNVCHVFMNGLNRVQVHGLEKLHDALLNRPKNIPLLTVSNHVASMDDPLVIASLLPPRVLLDSQNLRWTLCASDRCFRNPATSAFFRSVKVLPLSRGDGIYQKGMDMAISKLNNGGWVHIFPEGSRSRDGGNTMGSAKRGVGRLILDADTLPIVVPFVHTGMQDIMPLGSSIPRIGKMVTVIVGDPICFDDLINSEGAKHVSRKKLYDAVASRIGQRLQELKVRVDKLALEHSNQLQNHIKQCADKAADIIHHVDWDSLNVVNPYRSDENSAKLKDPVQNNSLNVRTDKEELDQYNKTRFINEGGIMPRIRRYMDSTELMGFAARGLFLSNKMVLEEPRKIIPVKEWKEYFEANLLRQWNGLASKM